MMKYAYEVGGLDQSFRKTCYSDAAEETTSLPKYSNSPITVLLVDDHAVVRAGCRLALEDAPDIRVVAEAEDGEAGCALYKEYTPDVVLLDLNLSGISGIETTRRIKAQDSKARILAFSLHTDTDIVQRVLEAGAAGYLVKQCGMREMVEAVREVAGGRSFIDPEVAKSIPGEKLFASSQYSLSVLTSRELQVFKMLAEGHAISDIADSLSISSKTVGAHHANIMRKLGLRNNAQIVRLALRCEVVEP